MGPGGGRRPGHSRTNKWHLQKHGGTRECDMYKEYKAGCWGWEAWGRMKRDETGEAEEQGHAMKDLVCDAKEVGGSGKPGKVLFLKGCFVCKAQGRPLLGKPSRIARRQNTQDPVADWLLG